MTSPQIIHTPSGEEMVVLSRADYEELVDLGRHHREMEDIRAGRAETFTPEQAAAYVAAPTPLAFWRRHRNFTQAALAEAAGVSQAYLAQVETGKRAGTLRLFAKLAARLGVRIDDLVEDEEPG